MSSTTKPFLPSPIKRLGTATATLSVMALAACCTGQLPNAFRLRQASESFENSQSIDTKIDMLWVIDNSASMDVSQSRLRDGFSAFAQKYMKPNWDIRVAVITSDTFLAHSAFTGYLNSQYEATGYKSNYLSRITSGGIPGRSTPFVNPSWAPALVNTNEASGNFGRFTTGSRVKDNWPKYGPNWAKLQAGNHDGPMTTLCYENNPYFFKGVGNCRIRDDETANTGVSHCVTPSGAETSVTQCINTSMNDTVHSGKPVISTMPPSGTPANAAWTNQLVSDFLVNISTGASGNGSERAMGSVLQLFADNETTATPFFRTGALRVVVFVADEDDQTQSIPSSPPGGFDPWSYYSSSCTPKTVDGYTYTISYCPDPSKLVPVSTIKSQFDAFFSNLDTVPGGPAAAPNYFVISLVAINGSAIQSLHAERCTEENAIFGSCSTSVDRGDRYLQLADLVGNGSLKMDITATNYSPILDAIGQTVVAKKSVFTLARAPTGSEDIIFMIRHIDGSIEVVSPSQYTLSGKTVTVTDYNFLLTLSATDRIEIAYQPRSVF